MSIYRVWITTHIERPLYVDAEDGPTAEAAAWEYLSDSATFWPTLATPWDYADAEDYIDADESRSHDDMAPGEIRAILTKSGEVGYSVVGKSSADRPQLHT